jgi:hypothetical protein
MRNGNEGLYNKMRGVWNSDKGSMSKHKSANQSMRFYLEK